MYKYEKLREYFTENYGQTELFFSDYVLSEIMDVAREEIKIAREKANGVDPTNVIALPIPVVMESKIEAYAAFCIVCDRKGMKPIKYKDYLEIGKP